MKTAIVSDWLITLGGAEKFLKYLLECFSTADLFAVVDFIPAKDRDFLQGKPSKTTFIQRLPLAKKYYRHYLPLMPYAIEQLDLRGYDLIISSSHAVAKGVITGPDQLHISYVHSPMRYAWDLQHQYLKETGLDQSIRGHFARYFLHKLRLWDTRSANNVDYFIANSHFIARRIKKVYRRSAEVIYPPVDVSCQMPLLPKDEFYLTASRFVPYKKIDLIVETFNELPDKQLIVIGDGPDFKKIQQKAAKNVHLLGYQNDETLHQYLQRARAFVFAAEEDFGILPVEAQACGTPVIAYGKGGALESVRGLSHDRPTGVFFTSQSPSAIIDAIGTFENNEAFFSRENCMKNAACFNVDTFKEKFTGFVKDKLSEYF